jgi:hypothetical protein
MFSGNEVTLFIQCHTHSSQISKLFLIPCSNLFANCVIIVRTGKVLSNKKNAIFYVHVTMHRSYYVRSRETRCDKMLVH